jgi:hypothetical protein
VVILLIVSSDDDLYEALELKASAVLMVGTLLRIPEVLGSNLSQETGCSADVGSFLSVDSNRR